MLYRDYKTLRAESYYHVFNRGVNKQPIYFDEQDYSEFIYRLKVLLGLILPKTSRTSIHVRPFPSGTFSILSYCLMPNHFHFFIRQNSQIGINKLILKLCTSYAMYINKKHNRVGNLFQDTFKARLVQDDQYGMYLSAYIHNNPQDPKSYPYSSYQEILNLREDQISDRKLLLSWFNNSEIQYEQFVSDCYKSDEQFKQKFSF